MRMKYYGDSFDIIKRYLIYCLRSFGNWSVYPMFTEEVSKAQSKSFSSFLNARIISNDVIDINSDRNTYFNNEVINENIFLDPNTGLKINNKRTQSHPDYLYSDELVHIVERQTSFLTMVFDQSLGRGNEKIHVEKKLQILREDGINGFGYVSHASFLIFCKDNTILRNAQKVILQESRIPSHRFLIS